MRVQNSCSSDANGEFSIAKTNDILVFVSKEHQIKITINPKLFTRLVVELILKAEELNEVVIIPSIK
jgi:hypothetical protein